MLSVQDAEKIVFAHAINLQTEVVNLEMALGRVLAEPILADRDFPPFDRVMMDGIALNTAAFAGAGTMLQIEGIVAAGSPLVSLKTASHCLEVMTGAMLPLGCNAVVRYEDVSIENGNATINIADVVSLQNIHPQGLDRQAGSLICQAGQIISAAEIGVLATVGKFEVLVQKKFKVVIISTGDELVPVEAMPAAHQIRSSNGYALQAVLMQHGVEASYIHLADNETEMMVGFAEALSVADALVLSGGVSAGKFDFVPKVLKSLGVEEVFHKVSQRPGKPFWFGLAKEQKPVFALPGNPVSTFMCLHRYVLPWLNVSKKQQLIQKTVILEEDFSFKQPLTMFLQVKVRNQEGMLFATPKPGNGSGDLANLVDADGFVELPLDKNFFAKNTVLDFWAYR